MFINAYPVNVPINNEIVLTASRGNCGRVL
jgi:hypothetical protein